MNPHDLLPESFRDIADIEKIDPAELLNYEQTCPVWARPVMDSMGGVRLVPHDPDGFDVEFHAGFGAYCPSDIQQVSAMLNLELYPIGASDNRNGLLLLAANGECYGMPAGGYDLSYLGQLDGAVRIMLTGKALQPVLPVRDYPQWHNVDVYPPGDERVRWVAVDKWWTDTRA
jgi:hypothetical protein